MCTASRRERKHHCLDASLPSKPLALCLWVSSVPTFPQPLVTAPSLLEVQDESGVDRNLLSVCPFGQWEMKADPWVKLTKPRDRLEPG